jgi:hypothetical protein
MEYEQARNVVEHTLAILRASLNNALRDKAYDADEHNLCIAIVEFADGSSDVLAAYSDDSALRDRGIFDFLGLIPNTYPWLKKESAAGGKGGGPYGCDGMAQYHTEPKLLNYLSASPDVRRQALQAQRPLFKATESRKDLQGLNRILDRQLDTALRHAERLPAAADVVKVTLASEIDCCPTCLKHSIEKFNARYPHARLERNKTLFELGKKAGQPTPYAKTKVTRTP